MRKQTRTYTAHTNIPQRGAGPPEGRRRRKIELLVGVLGLAIGIPSLLYAWSADVKIGQMKRDLAAAQTSIRQAEQQVGALRDQLANNQKELRKISANGETVMIQDIRDELTRLGDLSHVSAGSIVMRVDEVITGALCDPQACRRFLDNLRERGEATLDLTCLTADALRVAIREQVLASCEPAADPEAAWESVRGRLISSGAMGKFRTLFARPANVQFIPERVTFAEFIEALVRVNEVEITELDPERLRRLEQRPGFNYWVRLLPEEDSIRAIIVFPQYSRKPAEPGLETTHRAFVRAFAPELDQDIGFMPIR